MSEQADRPPFFPIAVDVEAGKTYCWCSCGLSESQPFCDRDNCDNKAIPYFSRLSETLVFCACKETKDPPFCDGSHGRLLIEFMKNRKT